MSPHKSHMSSTGNGDRLLLNSEKRQIFLDTSLLQLHPLYYNKLTSQLNAVCSKAKDVTFCLC